MIPEAKKLWLKALRSGKYKQTRGALCINNEYCCLGVLVDILGEFNPNPSKKNCCDDNPAYLPERIVKLVGMAVQDQYMLANLNDKSNSTFLEIADYIERKL